MHSTTIYNRMRGAVLVKLASALFTMVLVQNINHP